MSFVYDSGGNLTSSPGQSYAYDYADRLTSVTNGNGTHTLAYDALSRLSTVGGSTNDRYSYDGQDMIERRNSTGSTLEARYIHGPGSDEPIARYTYSSPTSYTRTFYSVDVRGSIIGHTQGAVSTAINSYDVYGRPDGSNTGLYQYTGQIWLEELELYYYKARFYDPKIRRFLNADPIGYAAGMNMYGYVSGDPVNMVDPSGLSECKPNEENCFTVPGVRRKWKQTTLTWDEFLATHIGAFSGIVDFGGIKDSLSEAGAAAKAAVEEAKVCIMAALNTLVAQGEISVGFAAGGGIRTPIKGTSGRIDFFSVRFRFGTEQTGIFLTQGVQASYSRGPFSTTAGPASRDVRAKSGGGSFDNAPLEPIGDLDIGFVGVAGELQFVQGVGGQLGIDSLDFAKVIATCGIT